MLVECDVNFLCLLSKVVHSEGTLLVNKVVMGGIGWDNMVIQSSNTIASYYCDEVGFDHMMTNDVTIKY